MMVPGPVSAEPPIMKAGRPWPRIQPGTPVPPVIHWYPAWPIIHPPVGRSAHHRATTAVVVTHHGPVPGVAGAGVGAEAGRGGCGSGGRPGEPLAAMATPVPRPAATSIPIPARATFRLHVIIISATSCGRAPGQCWPVRPHAAARQSFRPSRPLRPGPGRGGVTYLGDPPPPGDLLLEVVVGGVPGRAGVVGQREQPGEQHCIDDSGARTS